MLEKRAGGWRERPVYRRRPVDEWAAPQGAVDSLFSNKPD